MSKILEKLIYSKFNSFLIKHNVILSSHYGFRSKLSTTDALLHVTTMLYDQINKSHHSALIMLNLKKTFDPVQHNILLQKLHFHIVHDLLSSFLHNIRQLVMNNSVT